MEMQQIFVTIIITARVLILMLFCIARPNIAGILRARELPLAPFKIVKYLFLYSTVMFH